MVNNCGPEKIQSSRNISSSMLYWMNYQRISIRETNWHRSHSELENRKKKIGYEYAHIRIYFRNTLNYAEN